MSRLYWKSQIIATTDSNLIKFTPSTVGRDKGGLPNGTSDVSSTLEFLATRKTGIIMSTVIGPNDTVDDKGRRTKSFQNSMYFNDNMYVDYYCDQEINFYQYPTYNDVTHTITYYIDKLPEDVTEATFKIVVQF